MQEPSLQNKNVFIYFCELHLSYKLYSPYIFIVMTFCYSSCVPLILLLTKIFVPFLIFRKIKVWDLVAALDPRAPTGTLCLRTLVEHSGRVFRLQFDEFQIVSSSHDDTILIWDFLNDPATQADPPRSPSRTYTYISR